MFDFLKRKKKEQQPIRLKQDQNLTITFDSTLSEILCCATSCFFNRFYRGEFCCDLKRVEIGKNGQCNSFMEKEKRKQKDDLAN